MTTSSTPFESAYSRLNTLQKAVVDTLDGPVMVIAGPGTGKTQILATRIANILLKTDTPPYAILALTFTESAAKNMRERLISLIGPTAYSVNVQTFHAFCDEVIHEYPEYFSIHRESVVLSDLERFDVLEKILEKTKLSALRTLNSPFHYLKSIMKSISDLKREGVTEVQFADLVAAERERFENEKSDLKKTEVTRQEKRLLKMQELAVVYTQYQYDLLLRKRYDYDDMIAFVLQAFENEETLLLSYQEKLTYFLVDEYQDTNASQNRVVDLLASFWGDKANIFVVGDPHQSVYRFQGASLENTLNFVGRYPTATVITLDIGYRCPQDIYSSASAVISRNTLHSEEAVLLQLQKPLRSVQNKTSLLRVYPAHSSPLETIFIAEEIKKLLSEGVHPSEIAVLYRNNSDVFELQLALDKWDIPYAIDGGDDVLKNEIVVQFLTLLQIIADIRTANEGHELYEVMNYQWIALDRSLVMKIARAAGKTKMTMFEKIADGYEAFHALEFCDDVSEEDFATIQTFLSKIIAWGQLDSQVTFPEFFETVMNESGFLTYVLSLATRFTQLHQVNALYREVKALAKQNHTLNLEDFLEAVATMREHGIHITAEVEPLQDSAIRLSTVHKAKGQEWNYVFLMQCIDGKWGNSRKMNELPLPEGILTTTEGDDVNRDEDDRRLFYVALTRTKKICTISYAQVTVSGNKSKENVGSLFIEEIPAEYKEVIRSEELLTHADEYLTKLLQTREAPIKSEKEVAWLKAILSDYTLSVTALNAYLRSPQKFLEEHVLRVPRAKQEYQAFGTAIHFALEKMFSSFIKQNAFPSLEEIFAAFKESLEREIVLPKHFPTRLEQGEKVLRAYYDEALERSAEPLTLEKFFGYGKKIMLGDVSINGRIDRIDWLDKLNKSVIVIDYKTGHAQTVNEINGLVGTEEFSERELTLPESIRGPYKRQLLFYKLLAELDPTFEYTVNEGVFDFVQENASGKFVVRRFPLLAEDVADLKELITVVMNEIRSLAFLEK